MTMNDIVKMFFKSYPLHLRVILPKSTAYVRTLYYNYMSPLSFFINMKALANHFMILDQRDREYFLTSDADP
jgi:hypothetical protein